MKRYTSIRRLDDIMLENVTGGGLVDVVYLTTGDKVIASFGQVDLDNATGQVKGLHMAAAKGDGIIEITEL